MKPVLPTAVTRRQLRVSTAARPSSRVGLAALVAALVVGILGMHALPSHGAPAATTDRTASAAHTSSMIAMSPMSGMPSGHDTAMEVGDSHEGHTTAASTAGGGGSGRDMVSTVMLCVVMLAAAALTLLVVLAAGVLRLLLPAAFKPAAVRERALQRVRGTGPPHEWQFSVIRC
ncbi:hypothetical protein ASC64_07140 [Nocardioides sp. Root122]|uniref:hypothetical protein n=1 Tax=Nocardioides TaxID=1839 RepID=UPI000702E04B|nr:MULTISPECIES: hypothetical protein [Nocardioides]KQV69613.1 hypothetical protein ASC64_07140 [Nocardioides sp. Root122]MCK9824458.1 hypothetical protein [Nocardioides cavernae]